MKGARLITWRSFERKRGWKWGIMEKHPDTNPLWKRRALTLEEGMATHSSILAWRFPKARGACWAYISWGCKELDTTLWLSTFCIKTFSKLEIENFFNLIKVLNCISSITFYGRTLIVLLLKSQSTKRCPLSLYWISVHEVILENDWEVIQFGKEE